MIFFDDDVRIKSKAFLEEHSEAEFGNVSIVSRITVIFISDGPVFEVPFSVDRKIFEVVGDDSFQLDLLLSKKRLQFVLILC